MTEVYFSDSFQKFHGQWSDETFGKRNPTAPLYHLKKEVNELIEAPYDIEEYADGFLLLIDAARIAGHTMEDIGLAMMDKFDKNRHRKWGKPDKNGAVEHIRD